MVPRCLECHGSFFEPVSEGGAKSLSQTGLCARRFVRTLSWSRRKARELNAPGKPKPAEQAIVNPAKLTRERQLALCSLCHGGIGVAAPVFSFTVGNALEDFLKLETPKENEPLDPHGNQVALLERSKCFKHRR